jgi:hypothetical protein
MSVNYVLLWITTLVLMVSFAIAASRLIFRLREVYPRLYDQVGQPRILSRSTAFLWDLRRFKDELAPKDQALLKSCLVLLMLSWLSIFMFIGSVVFMSYRS